MFKVLSFLFLNFLALIVFAQAPLAPQDVPEPLKTWIPWALHGAEEQRCPFHYNQKELRRCVWPSQLALNLHARGGEFRQNFVVVYASWVYLPGDKAQWPQEVKVNGQPAVVLSREEKPAIFLSAGSHTVKGVFVWRGLPESLAMARDTALIALSVEGKRIEQPLIGQEGVLWLQKQKTERADDRVEVRVQRLIHDSIPLTVTTRIQLSVSGKGREVVLEGAVLPQALPLSLQSVLPARVEENSKVRMQLRPGQWEVLLTARYADPVFALGLPASTKKKDAKETKEVNWPHEEIWVFEAQTQLRLVTISGGVSVDPQQTTLPPSWKRFPAYRLRPGDTLKFEQARRGDPKPESDQLYLTRNIWLDFNGEGYTTQDTISGTLSSSWRLQMAAPFQLGHAALDGQDQLITRLNVKVAASDLSDLPLSLGERVPEGQVRETGMAPQPSLSGAAITAMPVKPEDAPGIEVRRGQVNLVADSRIESNTRTLPATGWKQDFQSVSMYLNVPPGWRLFTATGVDRVSGSWIAQWSLFDFFLVLLAVMGASYLWGRGFGVLVLIMLGLTFHEPNAPRWVWLHLFAAIALVRVLPEGKFQKLASVYRLVSLVVLVVIALPFAINQLRTAIYPVLETPWQQVAQQYAGTRAMPAAKMPRRQAERGSVAQDSADMNAPMSATVLNEALKSEAPELPASPEETYGGAESDKVVREQEALRKDKMRSYKPGKSDYFSSSNIRRENKTSKLAQSERYLDEIDPKAMIQTGPGLPQWQWHRYLLSWSGPVAQSQEMKLWLISPSMNIVLIILRVLLLSFVFLRVINWSTTNLWVFRSKALYVITGSLLVFGLAITQEKSYASEKDVDEYSIKPSVIPDKEVLQELKNKLLAPPLCLPQCAQISRMQLEVQGDTLRLRLEAVAQEDTAIPLPNAGRQWMPREVWLNTNQANVARDRSGVSWLLLPKGYHQLIIQGSLIQTNSLSLSLPLKPRHVGVVAQGWTVDGLNENSVPDDTLQLTRTVKDKNNALVTSQGNLPPFLRIERRLQLGLQWQVITRVVRMNSAETPMVLEFPLLPGEAITSNEIRVEQGKAKINLPAQTYEINWISSLKEQPVLKLKASKQTQWIEVWQLDASTQWHVELAGIPVVYHQGAGRRLPQWQPWPGEEVTINISKPEAVPGKTLTIDRSELTITPGERITDATLALTLRSSQGTEHSIVLPEGASLQSVTMNGSAQPIRAEGRTIRLPLTPGSHQITINWREARGIRSYFATPEVGLNSQHVNANLRINLPSDRWSLWLGGPRLGPAILFWGMVVALILIAFALGKVKFIPLKTHHWFLLGLGLTQAPLPLSAVMVGWLFALGWRKKMSDAGNLENRESRWSNFLFNFSQVLLVLWTIAALASLFYAVHYSLLGHPQMHIVGNGSYSHYLNWYQDRSNEVLPTAWVVSVPLYFYRVLMLLWALWLAANLLKWLRWAWECFTSGGYWRRVRLAKAKASEETMQTKT